jgi:hypothetical protein
MLTPPPSTPIARADVERQIGVKSRLRQGSPSTGKSAFALGVCVITQVLYEDFHVKLRTVVGEDQEYERVPVPLTFPGAGARHFLGSMPEVGDHCVVGFLPLESSGSASGVGAKVPVILAWIPQGVWHGYDWMVTQPFTVDEYDFTPRQNAMVDGVFQRVRHKLAHMQPGDVLASSSKGADLILDESVTLMNRRCNELKLRDQDQALILRSLQQFHAMSGTRIYGGMVQRDGSLLQTQMISDGLYWEAAKQRAEGNDGMQPVYGAGVNEAPDGVPYLEEWMTHPEGRLTPARILRMGLDPDGNERDPLFPLPTNLDPFTFLREGLFIDERGYAIDPKPGTPGTTSNAVYGGKPMYRVSAPTVTDTPSNTVTDPSAETLTEYRLEISHTSDGTLPVTEQTDGFDSDRVPAGGINTPFVEVVFGGSVVGNSPYTEAGRDQYGVPLLLSVFEGNTPTGNLASALGKPVGEHAATLFKLNPLDASQPTMWSVNKKGQFRAFIGGPEQENSIEAALKGGLKFRCKTLDLDFDALVLRSKTADANNGNIGLGLQSETGAVHIYGGGQITTGQASQNASGIEGADDARPSVLIEGANAAVMQSSKYTRIASAAKTMVDGSTTSVSGSTEVQVNAGDRLTMSSKEIVKNSNGKEVNNYSGPKDFLPTNGPYRETVFTGVIPGGTVDKTTYKIGDREEEFLQGSHSTTMMVGDVSYVTNLGKITKTAGTNTTELDTASGLSTVVKVGTVSIEAKAGTSSLVGQVSVTVKSTGKASLSGAAGAFLGGPGKVGMIISTGDIDPLTGLPFSSPLLGAMGSPGHTIGLPI